MCNHCCYKIFFYQFGPAYKMYLAMPPYTTHNLWDVTSFINLAVTARFFADAYFLTSAAHRPIFLTLNHVVKSASGRLTAAAGRLFGRWPILSSNDQIFGRCPGGVPAAIVQTPGGHRWESCRSPQDANESHGHLPFTYG